MNTAIFVSHPNPYSKIESIEIFAASSRYRLRPAALTTMLNGFAFQETDSSGLQFPGAGYSQRDILVVKEIRILLADDHALIRSGIRALIDKHPDFQIVAEASDGPEALRLMGQHQPDVALIKSEMFGLDGFGLTERVRKECPGVHVIVLSTEADEESLRRALACGAAGYLTMNTSAAELGLAIKRVAKGKTYVSAAATKLLMNLIRSGARDHSLNDLTPRQREVLQLIAEGKTTKQISLILKISVKTVETHRRLLTDRLDIHHTAGLVRYALKAGLIRLEG